MSVRILTRAFALIALLSSTRGFLAVGLLAAMALTMVATPVEAGHTSVGGGVTILRGGEQVRQYFSDVTPCNTTFCHVDVTGVKKVDLSRMVKACGSDLITFIIPAGSIGGAPACTGSVGPWTVHVAPILIDATGTDAATHDTAVTVEVQAHP